MNKIFIAGRLSNDPQPFVTQTGKLISNISIACQDNINKNEVYFFPCVAWQSNAKFINTYLKKGDSVVVDGKLVRRSYVSKEGKNVYITEIVIDSIKPFGSRPNNQNQQFSNPNLNYNNQKYNDSNEIYFEKNNENFNPSSFNNINNVFEDEVINQTPDGSYVHVEKNEQIGNDEIIDLDWLDEID